MNIPKVKDCIAYIESSGWKLTRQRRMWYIFESPTRKLANGSNEVSFTLTELREAYKYGW